MFRISLTPSAIDDIHRLRKRDQQQIGNAFDTQLLHEPNRETRNRKRLRPNALADWELRVGTFRVFYDVDLATQEVTIVAIGRKLDNRLFVHGQEYTL